MSLRICCIDDNPMCVQGISHALRQHSIECIGELVDLSDLRPILENHACDAIISEVRIKGEDVLEAWQDISLDYPNVNLILYCYNENPTHVARASANNVWEFVFKRQPVSKLLITCESLKRGERLEDSMVTTAKRYLSNHLSPASPLETPLTRREQQILVHLSLGLSNREISNSLKISLETVKEHVQNVLRKIKAADRTAAAVWAIRNGIPPLKLDAN
ncbi:MAG: response regulator transcription factor [Planctomycetes bacterium]|nr:response regulator transcription factor [Planctomycetota bacterium]